MSDVETGSYRITGLVDIFDEQNNIRGQYPVGSVQVLPIDQGERAVAAGQAEAVEDNDQNDENDENDESTDEDETDGDDEGEGEDDDELDGEDEVE